MDAISEPTAHDQGGSCPTPRPIVEAPAPKQKKRFFKFAVWGVGGLLLLLGLLLFTASSWIESRFGAISVRQMLTFVPGNADVAEIPKGYVRSFAFRVILASVGLTGCVTFVTLLFRRLSRRKNAVKLERTAGIAYGVISMSILVVGCWQMASTVNLQGYLRTLNGEYSMADYYVKPEVAQLPSGDLNLVVIYLESMDDAFGNKDLIGEDALTTLKEATDGWETIERLSHYPSGGWTMPGIVSTQCGLPKRPPESETTFFGNAVCLGDILSNAGYTNVWMGGADAEFEDKGLFLKSHGYDEVLMKDYWAQLGEDVETRDFWGLSDQRLFERAKEKIVDLRESGQPFNLELLTLDNHDPIYQWEYCPTTSEDLTISTVRCQSDIVADFLDFMKNNGFMEDTVVVIMADHSMHAQFHPVSQYTLKMDNDDQRNIPLFNRIYSPNPIEIVREKDNQLHMYPTLLELVGATVKDGRAGLGVSLLNSDSSTNSAHTIVGKDVDEIGLILEGPLPPEVLSSP